MLRALIALLLTAAPTRAAVFLEARVHVYQPACSQVQAQAVAQALSQAAALLAPCGLSLSLTAWTALPLAHGFCHPVEGRAAQRSALRALATAAKREDPGALALFLLPDGADERLSWATVDVSRASACDSPQEARFLDRFGQCFVSDLAWAQDLPKDEAGPTAPAFLLAHEVLHALSQRGHPSHAPRGSILADHLSDIGPAVSPELCACARRSPYAHPAAP
jgi:hypothetical protein